MIPAWLAARLEGRPLLTAVVGNTAWLGGDRVFRMALGLAIGVWTARYLGPERLGELSFVTAFVGLFVPLAALGLESICVRELLAHPDDTPGILGTSAALRGMGACLGGLAALGIHWAMWPAEGAGRLMVLVLILTQLAMPLDVVEFYFQSRNDPRRGIAARWVAMGIATILRVVLILTGAPVSAFAWALSVEALIGAAGLAWVYSTSGMALGAWRFSAERARRLVALGWPLAFSSVAVAIYMRLDQVMVKSMLGEEALGVFAVSVRVSELWYFVPTAIAAGSLPALMQLRLRGDADFDRGMLKLLSTMIALGLTIGLATSLAGPWALTVLYGEKYAGAGSMLVIQAWTGLFVGLGIAREHWLIARGMTKVSMVTTMSGAVLNVALNMVLIPRWGGRGAAVASLVAQACATTFFLGLYRPSRPLFALQIQAFWLPRWMASR